MEEEIKRVCSNCANLRYWKQEETDCCYVPLYKCAANKKEIIDDFHIDYKKCKDFQQRKKKKKQQQQEETEETTETTATATENK